MKKKLKYIILAIAILLVSATVTGVIVFINNRESDIVTGYGQLEEEQAQHELDDETETNASEQGVNQEEQEDSPAVGDPSLGGGGIGGNQSNMDLNSLGNSMMSGGVTGFVPGTSDVPSGGGQPDYDTDDEGDNSGSANDNQISFGKESGVMIFADWPETDQTDAEKVKKYFDAGFTHMLLTEDGMVIQQDGEITERYLEAISRVQKLNKHVIVGAISGNAGRLGTLTTEFADMGIRGFYYDDEPTYEKISAMSGLVTWHNKYNSGAKFHVNLLPSYAGRFGKGNYSFKQYIQHYADTVLAKVKGKKTLSIDHYPLMTSGLSATYLSDLLVVAETVKKFNETHPNSPAEASFCIQAYCEGDRRALASIADVRFQVNMAIAMGARNLEYYQYRTGILDMLNAYKYVKTVNQEVLAWDDVFMVYDWQGTRMYGDSSDPLYKKAEDKFVSAFAKATVSANKATVVSEFKKANGSYAYMAVNATDPGENESTAITIRLKGASRVTVYKNGAKSTKKLTDATLKLTLKAGESAFCIPLY